MRERVKARAVVADGRKAKITAQSTTQGAESIVEKALRQAQREP